MLQPLEKEFHKRNLPHYQPQNGVFFITARLDGSLPKIKIQQFIEERQEEEDKFRQSGLSEEDIKEQIEFIFDKYFKKFDALLDGNSEGPHHFKNPQIAEIWEDALAFFDGERYKLICSTIMSNHDHFIFFKLDRSLSRMMHSLKSFTGLKANKILGKTGQRFWQEESYDRAIRDRQELQFRIHYVLNNPVEVGLVEHWRDWEYNYIHPDFLSWVEQK